MIRIAPCVIAALALGLSACTNPYDPVQRGLGGGVLGAASGAAIGAAAGGGPGAALGAAIGGATGIFGGVASTPSPPPGTYFGYPAYGPPAYGYPGYGYIPATALRRTGRLEPSTVSSLLAEFRPEIHSQSSTPLIAARANASVKCIARRGNRQHSIAA
jgi:hypothetical protein